MSENKDQIDLSDSVFMIPVRIDGSHREKHLLFILRRLLSKFSSKIMLYEDDVKSKVKSKVPLEILNRCQYKFFPNLQAKSSFRKAMLLNEMMIDSSERILIPHDSEVFLNPIENYVSAVKMVRDGVCSGVIPHHVCSRYDVVGDDFYHTEDFKHLRHTKNYPLNLGGILVLDREMVLSCGMWNQEFVTWGEEDSEFMNRLQKFGYKIERLKQPIYHLNHPKNDNGFYARSHSHNKMKYRKIKQMGKKAIEKMIVNWSWVKRAKDR